MHSDASSDGRSTLQDLAAAARKLGRRYLAITNHSRSRPLGLDDEQLKALAKRVRQTDGRSAGQPHLLAGIEVDILAAAAKEKGVKLAISSDAHHESQLGNLKYGIWVARRGWLEAGDVVNVNAWDSLRRRRRHTA